VTSKKFSKPPGCSTSHFISATLDKTTDNPTHAAGILSITRQTLQNKLKEYNLS
jgi:DNA-binding protein Fis